MSEKQHPIVKMYAAFIDYNGRAYVVSHEFMRTDRQYRLVDSIELDTNVETLKSYRIMLKALGYRTRVSLEGEVFGTALEAAQAAVKRQEKAVAKATKVLTSEQHTLDTYRALENGVKADLKLME